VDFYLHSFLISAVAGDDKPHVPADLYPRLAKQEAGYVSAPAGHSHEDKILVTLYGIESGFLGSSPPSKAWNV
jgi:hypothetical protein